MTSIDEEKNLKDFHEHEKQLKITYCKSLGLDCKANCPPDRAGCVYHPDHEKAIKEELADYED